MMFSYDATYLKVQLSGFLASNLSKNFLNNIYESADLLSVSFTSDID